MSLLQRQLTRRYQKNLRSSVYGTTIAPKTPNAPHRDGHEIDTVVLEIAVLETVVLEIVVLEGGAAKWTRGVRSGKLLTRCLQIGRTAMLR